MGGQAAAGRRANLRKLYTHLPSASMSAIMAATSAFCGSNPSARMATLSSLASIVPAARRRRGEPSRGRRAAALQPPPAARPPRARIRTRAVGVKQVKGLADLDLLLVGQRKRRRRRRRAAAAAAAAGGGGRRRARARRGALRRQRGARGKLSVVAAHARRPAPSSGKKQSHAWRRHRTRGAQLASGRHAETHVPYESCNDLKQDQNIKMAGLKCSRWLGLAKLACRKCGVLDDKRA